MASTHPAAAATWVQIFQDPGIGSDWTELYKRWGTNGKHTIQNTSAGLRVAGGGTLGNDDQRVVLWIGTTLPTKDFVLQYSVRRNDSMVLVGTATMLLLSTKGGSAQVPADPTTINVGAPSLSFVDNNLNALRLSTMTAYNPQPANNAQLRLRRLPGAVEIASGSLNQFPFTPGVWNFVKITKLGNKVTVKVTPSGQAAKSHSWTNSVIGTRNGTRIGFYLQEGRDLTLKNIKLFKRG